MESIEGLLTPIEGDNPAGPSLRYDPVYDEIKRAREEEDDSLPQGEWKRERKVADYPLAQKLATEVLESRSKDLQVAAWLTEALTRREGFPGLRDGLVLLRRLMEEFWDHVHPEIDEDGDLEFRAVPLEWVGLYLKPSVEAVPITEADLGFFHHRESRTVPTEEESEKDSAKASARKEALAAGRTSQEDMEAAFVGSSKAFYKELVSDIGNARDALGELESFCDERFGDVSPNLIDLRENLGEIQRIAEQYLARKLEAEPDPVEVAPDPEADDAGTGSDDGTGGDGGSDVGAAASGPATGGGNRPAELRSRDDAASLVAEAARFMRRATPSDPTPYLLLRGLRWGELRAGGRGVDPKLLVAPPTSVRTRLKGMMLDSKWAELLDACEEVMAAPHGRGWLDLQRYVLQACEGLGSDFDGVSRAVGGALSALLQDLPELPRMTLMDDSPTANAETMEWLRRYAGAEGEGDGDEAPAPVSAPDPGEREIDRRVQSLLASRPQEAIQLLMRRASQEKSARARFLRRSQAARIMVEKGLGGVALPILQEMMEQVERHSLEEWEEGETVALPMALLFRCLEQMGGDESQRKELYLRICRLDPMQAMSFGGKGEGNGGSEA